MWCKTVLVGGLVFAAAQEAAAESVNAPLFSDEMSLKCLPAIKDALVKRRWEILQMDDSSVSAEIAGRGRNVDGNITIFFQDDSWFYQTSGKKRVKPVGGNISIKTQKQADIPDKWIRNLQTDAKKFCRSVSDDKHSAEAIADRLNNLSALLEQGFITEQEYHARRKSILSSI